MNAPAESTYVPLAVAELPDAYGQVNREVYDATKAYWISQQVTALTRGYYSVLQPMVLERAHAYEQRAQELVTKNAGQTPDAFASALRENAMRTLADWQGLHSDLLVALGGGRHVDYGTAQQLESDKVQKY